MPLCPASPACAKYVLFQVNMLDFYIHIDYRLKAHLSSPRRFVTTTEAINCTKYQLLSTRIRLLLLEVINIFILLHNGTQPFGPKPTYCSPGAFFVNAS